MLAVPFMLLYVSVQLTRILQGNFKELNEIRMDIIFQEKV